MIRLSRYFEIAFDAPAISDDALRAFTGDHLAKLIAQNDTGTYDLLVAATATALSGFHGKVADESTAAAIRKSRTSATNVLMDEIKGKWSRREGKIRDTFEDGTPTYLAFYPQGVTEYRNASMEEMATLLTRYASLAAEHTAELSQPFADEWASYKTRWSKVRGDQITQKATTTGAADESHTARTTLEHQLQTNLLTIAIQNLGHPEREPFYFQQSLLGLPATPDPTPAPEKPPTP